MTGTFGFVWQNLFFSFIIVHHNFSEKSSEHPKILLKLILK
jgi:hypothetical protein